MTALAPAATTVTTALSASGLTKQFGDRTAVSDLTFRVAQGRAFGLLGPNGAGKTTTVRLLTGLLAPTSGTVRLFGETLTRANADELRARIGVQTDTNLYESLSVRHNLEAWGGLYGLDGPTIARRTTQVLEVLGLADRVDSLVGELSKGMRQKASIARAVLHGPDLLFLDEPTAGLDPEAALDLVEYLRQMVRSSSTTVVICTHQLHGLEQLCDDVGILQEGRLLVAGDVGELLAARWPRHRFAITVDGPRALAARTASAVLGEPVDLTGEGAELEVSVDDEATISRVVEALVQQGIGIRAVVPQVPTLQDLYFATIDDGHES